jgi:M6 family metalloprotease-like protein
MLFLAALAAALITAAPGHGTTAPRADPASRCAPPSLGFGDGEGRNDARMPPTTGALRVAMLFVDFADSPGAAGPESIYEASVPAVSDWVRGVSYGRLQLSVVPVLRWLRLPRTLAEYQQDRYEGAVQAAIAAADPTFDFSSIDALYLVPALDALASTIVDHDPLRIDGAEIRAWSWVATGSLERLGPRVLIHETGHVLGLPDLYRSGLSSSQHVWDVMTSGPWTGLLSWHRWKLGWLEAGEIVCLTRRGSVQATIEPVERPGGAKAIVVRTGAAAVVAEVRRPLAEDARLCAKGVLFYRVDFALGAPGAVGGTVVPIRLRPAHTGSSARCGPAWRAAFVSGGRASAWGVQLRVVRAEPDGSYTVRLTRR